MAEAAVGSAIDRMLPSMRRSPTSVPVVPSRADRPARSPLPHRACGDDRIRGEGGHPLTATFARAAADDAGFAASAGTPVTGMLAIATLAARPWTLQRAVHDSCIRRGAEDAAAGGASLLDELAWRVVAPTLAAVLLEHRAPALGAEVVAVALPAGTPPPATFTAPTFLCLPDDHQAAHPAATPVATAELLHAAVRSGLADTLAPLVGGLSVITGHAPDALWGRVADIVVASRLRIGAGPAAAAHDAAHSTP